MLQIEIGLGLVSFTLSKLIGERERLLQKLSHDYADKERIGRRYLDSENDGQIACHVGVVPGLGDHFSVRARSIMISHRVAWNHKQHVRRCSRAFEDRWLSKYLGRVCAMQVHKESLPIQAVRQRLLLPSPPSCLRRRPRQ